jgi:hypothetical protein
MFNVGDTIMTDTWYIGYKEQVLISHYDDWDNVHKIVTMSNVGNLNMYAYNKDDNSLLDMTRNDQKYDNVRVVK